jgi:hypothetical protein
MEEAKKATPAPAALSVSPGVSSASPASNAGTPVPPKQRRPRIQSEPGKGPATTKYRPRRDAGSLKFEAIKALTNLAEDGKFLLLYEIEGKTETVNCWN